ncbi:MAG TPA: MFS transporter [Roseimicrobium sp.]|nr:MFS transporter [Roseimicrobium sp.]
MTASATDITYRYERWRAVSAGMIETAATTFLLLIAVRWFHADAWAKAVVAAAGSVGLLLSPLAVAYVARRGWPVAKGASRLSMMGAAAFLVMAAVPFLPVYAVGSVVALAAASSALPFITQIYHENYHERERGSRFSRTMMIRIGVAAAFSEFAGRVLSVHIDYFRLLLLMFAAAFAVSAYCFSKIPSQPLETSSGSHPLRSLKYVKEDRMFRLTLVAWMLMGTGNLVMYPLRVEYLANPKYHLALEISTIALLVGVIPNMARLIMSPIWGWLFDRMNFFALRIVLNLGFMLGILSFFTSDSLYGLMLGSVIFGIANAGGDVAWSLWVTKFAPPERVADYMAVHTFFTGIRGVAAPVLAFHLVTSLGMVTMGWICAVLIALSMVVLARELRFGKKARPATPLAEEVSE